jgi:hypothetical protein
MCSVVTFYFLQVTVSQFFWRLCTKDVQEQMLNGTFFMFAK